MNTELLRLYDREMRAAPEVAPGMSATRADGVLRLTGLYNCIIHSELSAENADAAIDRQVAFFRGGADPVEWKVHAHDRPADLGERLAKRGFRPDPPETLLVCEIDRGLTAGAAANDAVDVRRVETETDLDAFLDAVATAFGHPFVQGREETLAAVAAGTMSLHVAYLDGSPVAAGRLDMPPSRSFAGLYTGGVAPAHRGKGLYRALVNSRAREAQDRGYSYLITEALETSRPILERVGFRRLTTVQGWVLEP